MVCCIHVDGVWLFVICGMGWNIVWQDGGKNGRLVWYGVMIGWYCSGSSGGCEIAVVQMMAWGGRWTRKQGCWSWCCWWEYRKCGSGMFYWYSINAWHWCRITLTWNHNTINFLISAAQLSHTPKITPHHLTYNRPYHSWCSEDGKGTRNQWGASIVTAIHK